MIIDTEPDSQYYVVYDNAYGTLKPVSGPYISKSEAKQDLPNQEKRVVLGDGRLFVADVSEWRWW